jgi:hypothetical protein
MWKPDGTPGPKIAGNTGPAAWSPDGKWLGRAEKHAVTLWGTDGTAGPVLEGCSTCDSSIAWSPDGRWISTGDFWAIQTWNAATGEPRWVVLLLEDDQCVTLSADGEFLHGEPEDLEKRFVYLVEKSNGALEALTPTEFHKRVAAEKAAARKNVAEE